MPKIRSISRSLRHGEAGAPAANALDINRPLPPCGWVLVTSSVRNRLTAAA
jgi:hypothetical protein